MRLPAGFWPTRTVTHLLAAAVAAGPATQAAGGLRPGQRGRWRSGGRPDGRPRMGGARRPATPPRSPSGTTLQVTADARRLVVVSAPGGAHRVGAQGFVPLPARHRGRRPPTGAAGRRSAATCSWSTRWPARTRCYRRGPERTMVVGLGCCGCGMTAPSDGLASNELGAAHLCWWPSGQRW